MYATKARRARPEPFAVRPGIAERLGLPYMDFSLGFAAIALAAISIYTLEHATAQAGTNPIVEGVQLVLRQFLTAFERLDVTPVEAAGQPFDPNLHEAISQQESDAPPGTVVQVLQRGYKSGDRLLRPALVVVAKAKTAQPQAE